MVIDGDNFLSMPTQEGCQALDSDRGSLMGGKQLSNRDKDAATKGQRLDVITQEGWTAASTNEYEHGHNYERNFTVMVTSES